MDPVQFSITGLPRGQGRPRTAVRGRHATIYKASVDREYEKAIAAIATKAMAGRPPMRGPVSLSLRFRLPIAKSHPKKVREAMAAGDIAATIKPDLANALKAVEDAMNGIAYVDDVQIVRNFNTKIYSATPGIDVRVESFGEPEAGK